MGPSTIRRLVGGWKPFVRDGFHRNILLILFIDLARQPAGTGRDALGEAWLSYPMPSPDGHYLAYMKRTY